MAQRLTKNMMLRIAPEDFAKIERAAEADHRMPGQWVRLQAILAAEAFERELAESVREVIIERTDSPDDGTNDASPTPHNPFLTRA